MIAKVYGRARGGGKTLSLEREIARLIGQPKTENGLLWERRGVRREFKIAGRRGVLSWTDPTSPMGRFGGGWQYEFGIQVGGSTVIVNLVWFSIRIEKRRARK